jgi:hypothetical protein
MARTLPRRWLVRAQDGDAAAAGYWGRGGFDAAPSQQADWSRVGAGWSGRGRVGVQPASPAPGAGSGRRAAASRQRAGSVQRALTTCRDGRLAGPALGWVLLGGRFRTAAGLWCRSRTGRRGRAWWLARRAPSAVVHGTASLDAMAPCTCTRAGQPPPPPFRTLPARPGCAARHRGGEQHSAGQPRSRQQRGTAARCVLAQTPALETGTPAHPDILAS